MRCTAQWSDHVVIERCILANGHTGRHEIVDRWASLRRRWDYGDVDDAGDVT